MICPWPCIDSEKLLPSTEHGVIIGQTVVGVPDTLECFICPWESGEVGGWQRWEGSEVAKWERWEGNEVERWGR